MNYLDKYPAKKQVKKFADGGAAPMGGGGAPPTAAPDPAAGGTPAGDPAAAGGGDPMAAAGGPMGAPQDPAAAGAEQPGQDAVAQLESLVQQYQQAPTPQLEQEAMQLLIQLFGQGQGQDPGAAGDPMAQGGGAGGAMPPAGGGAPAPAAGAGPAPGGGDPAAGGAPMFRRGGVAAKPLVAVELPAKPKAVRKAKI